LAFYFFTRKEIIKVKKVEKQTTEEVKTVSASGYVTSTLESEVAFPVGGKLVSVSKKEGDVVKKGDLIAQIYSEDLFYDAESLKERRDAARRTLDAYVKQYSDRTHRVGGSDVYPINVKRLEDELAVQENLYKSSLSSLKKSYLYAPFSGTITKMPYEIGEVVNTSNSIILSDLNALEFQADLDQEDYKFVQKDQETEIVLDSYPDETFKGSVVSVPFYVDEDSSTRTFKIKIQMSLVGERIVKGMTGDVNIIVSKVANAKSLPFDAVFTEDSSGKKYVWTVDSSNKIQKQFIEVGLEGDTLTEIKSEIPEFVVVPDSNSKSIKEGTVASF